MPTFEAHPRFERDVAKLTREQGAQWRRALKVFVEAANTRQFPPHLRGKRLKSVPGVWEMSWADDGRATFEYGDEQRPGETHVYWRRIGTHDIFKNP